MHAKNIKNYYCYTKINHQCFITFVWNRSTLFFDVTHTKNQWRICIFHQPAYISLASIFIKLYLADEALILGKEKSNPFFFCLIEFERNPCSIDKKCVRRCNKQVLVWKYVQQIKWVESHVILNWNHWAH